MEKRSGFVEANDGVRLYYEDSGSGKPVFLIHGGGLSLGWWRKQVPALSQRFRVIAADTRGNGRSDKTPWGHRTARYAMDVRQIIETLDLDEVTLVGWSIGARTVLSYIELFRDYRLKGVVLVDEVPSIEVHGPPDPPEPDADADPESAADADPEIRPGSKPDPPPEDETERRRRQLRSMFVSPDVPDAELDVLLEESRENTPAQGVTLGPDYQAQDWRPMLPSIDLPVLIATGGRSGAYPGCKYMHEHIPGARMEVFEDSGHALFYEEPDRFNAVVAEFIDGLHAGFRG
ncbi:MAG: alpha/beta hydrolase [Gemmatimonadetes bacterium]|nr:alpha/beta hydrolase [Gemmatimonadota bacterium]MYG16551.1 alpha/beta hydrolase [Gemmatimonadota bacterium]